MKFAHLADCHLGGWRQPELNNLNFKSFEKAIEISISEKVNFVLIAGDLFDSSYPPIDTLKQTFRQFRKLKEANIPVFIIAGSHDYSASGKSFLDVLENSGFCINVAKFEEKGGKIILEPTIYQNAAIYGYPGKKSGLEVAEVERIKIQESPLFKILMLHTTLKSAVLNPNVQSVDDNLLPKVDYVALGHLHIKYNQGRKIYSGPTFPNNLPELEELQGGSFYIFDHGEIKRKELKIKEFLVINYTLKNTAESTNNIISILKKENFKDKVVILKIEGIVENGKIEDIDFSKIENFCISKGAYVFLKNTSKLKLPEPELVFDDIQSEDIENQIVKKFQDLHSSKFNYMIPSLLKTLQIEKIEDEKNSIFEERLLSEAKRTVAL